MFRQVLVKCECGIFQKSGKYCFFLLTRVLARIYRLGEKSLMAEGHQLPRGVQGHAPPPPPWKFFEMNMC